MDNVFVLMMGQRNICSLIMMVLLKRKDMKMDKNLFMSLSCPLNKNSTFVINSDSVILIIILINVLYM